MNIVNYITCAMSKKISSIFLEMGDFQNYIIAETLREKNLIVDSQIEFKYYIEVYQKVGEMFDVMSKSIEFLERVQNEAELDKLEDEQLQPIFRVPQHQRFFEYIFENKADDIKKNYLLNCREFASKDDGIAFLRLICKDENIALLDDNTFSRVYRNMWKLSSGQKGVFTKKWNAYKTEKLSS